MQEGRGAAVAGEGVSVDAVVAHGDTLELDGAGAPRR